MFWYVASQAAVFRHLTGMGRLRGWLFAIAVFVVTTTILLAATYLIAVGATLKPPT